MSRWSFGGRVPDAHPRSSPRRAARARVLPYATRMEGLARRVACGDPRGDAARALFVLAAGAALAAMDAEGAQLLVQVGALDPERLGGSRDVPLELGEPDADELRLDLLAKL